MPVLHMVGRCEEDPARQGMLYEPHIRFFYDSLDGMIRAGAISCLNPETFEGDQTALFRFCPGAIPADQIGSPREGKRVTPEQAPASIPAWKLLDPDQVRKARQQPHGATTMAAAPLHGMAAAGKPGASAVTNLAPLSLD